MCRYALFACLLLSEASPAPRPGQAWNLPLPGHGRLPMAWVGPGSFTMGSPDAETGRKTDESPQTPVTLSKGYWMGRTEVTVGQWKSVTGETLRAHVENMLRDDSLYDFGGPVQTLRAYMHFDPADPDKIMANEDEGLPMYFVSWKDAMDFCHRLTTLERTNGLFTGKKLGHSGAGPREAGEKLANPWGLQDMPGDRGGSWGSGANDERSANRAQNPQPEKSAYRGFRLALCQTAEP